VDQDPWELLYKLVRRKVGGQIKDSALNDSTITRRIINELFASHPPSQPLATYLDENEEPSEIQEFTEAELRQAAKRILSNKAPGPDKIPNEVIRTAIDKAPHKILDVLNRCLKKGHLGNLWTKQELLLIPKEGKPRGESSSYRPICLLDGLGKLFERLNYQRLQPYLENEQTGLPATQFGFRPKKSTIHAVERIVKIIRQGWEGSVKSSKHTAMISLDIKNAFNSATWNIILKTLKDRFRVPNHLIALIHSYFCNRQITSQGNPDEAPETRSTTAGVPRGSVLGPPLWDVLHTRLLEIALPPGIYLTAYADDTGVLIQGKTVEEIEERGQEALRRIERCLRELGLSLAANKTEAVLFTRKRTKRMLNLRIGDYRVKFTRSLK
jgi:predicted RNase H-like HicB family nuclease